MRHRICLRLLEKNQSCASEESQFQAVRSAIEKAGPVEWESSPSLHPKGGIRACFFVSQTPDYDGLFALLDREGYLIVM